MRPLPVISIEPSICLTLYRTNNNKSEAPQTERSEQSIGRLIRPRMVENHHPHAFLIQSMTERVDDRRGSLFFLTDPTQCHAVMQKEE